MVKTLGSNSTPLFVVFFLLTSLVLLSAGCRDKVKPGTAEVKRQAVTGVSVTEVHPSQVDEYYETSGTVKAKTISVVASRTMGTVTSLRVKEGDRVGAGQLLMTIDDRDMAQRVKAAEKGLEAAKQDRSLAEVTYQRYKKLLDGKAISQQEIDQIETKKKIADIEYERAKAMLAETQINHGFTRIAAPVSGVVTEKKIEVGSMAAPGMALLTVENNSAFTVEANLDEGLSSRLRTGMPVDVVIDSIGQKINGRIAELVPSVDPMSRTFLAKVEIRDGVRNSGLRTGLYAKLRIPTGTKEAVVVPAKAIVEKGQLTGIYAVDSRGIVTYRLVRTGKKYGDKVEILSGIDPNDRIVTDGVSRAVDGGILAGVKK